MLTVREVPRRGSLLRAGVATAEIMTGTLLAHAWAGGALPSPTWIGLIAVLVAGGTWAVQRGRVSLAVAVPAVSAVQLLLHCWLMTLAPAEPMAGMAHGSGAGAVGHLELTTPMLLAHVASAALTALVWTARRRAVEVLLTWARALRVPVPAVRPLALPSVPSYVVVEGLLCVAPRRGPPALPALA